MQNLVVIHKGFLFPVCAKLRIKNVYSATFFRILPTPHRSSRTDFQAKYVKQRGSAQGCGFLGLENKNLTFKPSYTRKTAILGTIMKTALQWGCSM